MMPSSLAADNQIGKFPPGNDLQGTVEYNQGIFLVGGVQASDKSFPGPQGTGAIFVLHMTANSGASGTVDFKLANVELSGNSVIPNHLNPTVNDGQITISGAK